jgi:hypothetical protein
MRVAALQKCLWRFRVNWVGAVTAGAAGLAAVLAGVNLYLSGRRELNKWTRETLIEIFALFLDASFKHASACRAISLESPPQSERDRLRAAIFAAHSEENRALTRLRLLAPPRVVKDARTLIESEYWLAKSCLYETISQENYNVKISPVRQGRSQFLEAARLALGLREPSGTGGFDSNASWSKLRISLDMSSGEQEEV